MSRKISSNTMCSSPPVPAGPIDLECMKRSIASHANAGYDGFRVSLFQQNDGIKAASGEPGLKFTVNFGMGMLNATHLGDMINDLIFQIRPYEIKQGDTDKLSERPWMIFVRTSAVAIIRIHGRCAQTAATRVGKKTALKNTASVLCKVYDHLYGKGRWRRWTHVENG
jgi:hypothetical protein